MQEVRIVRNSHQSTSKRGKAHGIGLTIGEDCLTLWNEQEKGKNQSQESLEDSPQDQGQ